MRDFNNDGQINIHGDFNISDNSNNQHKLLIHCSNEELLQERPFRRENIKIEQKKKIRRLSPLYAIIVILLVATATWATIHGKTDIITLILGAASLLIGYQTLKATIDPNAFQVEEQNAVNEINKLLKQRRAE
ncbi:hypothetical protein [Pseudomonas sp. LB3P14]